MVIRSSLNIENVLFLLIGKKLLRSVNVSSLNPNTNQLNLKESCLVSDDLFCFLVSLFFSDDLFSLFSNDLFSLSWPPLLLFLCNSRRGQLAMPCDAL